MSELAQAFAVVAEMPRLHAEAMERVNKAICRLTISDLHLLADSIETEYTKAGSFQSATGQLAVAIMRKLDVKVRVAVWHVDGEGKCQHKSYKVGTTTRAKIGEIGDPEWIEAWIA